MSKSIDTVIVDKFPKLFSFVDDKSNITKIEFKKWNAFKDSDSTKKAKLSVTWTTKQKEEHTKEIIFDYYVDNEKKNFKKNGGYIPWPSYEGNIFVGLDKYLDF